MGEKIHSLDDIPLTVLPIRDILLGQRVDLTSAEAAELANAIVFESRKLYNDSIGKQPYGINNPYPGGRPTQELLSLEAAYVGQLTSNSGSSISDFENKRLETMRLRFRRENTLLAHQHARRYLAGDGRNQDDLRAAILSHTMSMGIVRPSAYDKLEKNVLAGLTVK